MSKEKPRKRVYVCPVYQCTFKTEDAADFQLHLENEHDPCDYIPELMDFCRQEEPEEKKK